jgi:ribonuclease HI
MPAAPRSRVGRRAPRPEVALVPREGEVLLWTDGACSGNPGPGGWAAIVVWPDGVHDEHSGSAEHTTNNRMEYTAALEGLRSLPAGTRVCVVTDSRLMIDSMTRWIVGWKRKGYRTAGGDQVKNQDLVKALDAELARHDARWHWVRGHETGAAHAHKALNDRADRLAVAAAAAGGRQPATEAVAYQGASAVTRGDAAPAVLRKPHGAD